MRGILAVGRPLEVLGLPGAVWLEYAASEGLLVHHEAFADRGYRNDGTLVPRTDPGALLTETELVVNRCLRLVTEGVIEAVDGTLIAAQPDSICVHGDTPGAPALAHAIRAACQEAGILVRPFVGGP